MMPEEVHEVIAKILLCVFATFALCFSRARAEDMSQKFINDVEVEVTKSL